MEKELSLKPATVWVRAMFLTHLFFEDHSKMQNLCLNNSFIEYIYFKETLCIGAVNCKLKSLALNSRQWKIKVMTTIIVLNFC